ncbi:MAG: hypothetical protein ABI411_05190 [Tahibacter sp.]
MQRPWYRIAEVWLVLGLLSGSIVASALLIRAAVMHPDSAVIQHSGLVPPVRAPVPPA